jgi:hypothetical protein
MQGANMQVAPEQGAFMALLAELTGARRCVEVGVYTGYSSLAVALVRRGTGMSAGAARTRARMGPAAGSMYPSACMRLHSCMQVGAACARGRPAAKKGWCGHLDAAPAASL